MGLTPDRQRTEVGEGLAVGCIVVGVAAVADDGGALDAAFSSALAAWPWATRYPVLARAGRPALATVMQRSASRRAVKVAQWVTYRGLHVPQLRDDAWDLAGACAGIEEATTVPARRWCDLAEAIVGALDDRLVWRHPPMRLAVDPDDPALDLG